MLVLNSPSLRTLVKHLAMLPAGLFLVLVTVPSSLPVYAATAKVLEIGFPDAPSGDLNVVSDNFLGISWELFPMNYLCGFCDFVCRSRTKLANWLGGESPETMPNAMKNYLSNIKARMSNPLRIRVGGNSMDGSQYVASQLNMISLTDGDAYYNDARKSPFVIDTNLKIQM